MGGHRDNPADIEGVIPDDLVEFMSSDPDDRVSQDEAQAEAAAERYSDHVLDMGHTDANEREAARAGPQRADGAA
jgi:hypothetical protein